MMTFYFNLILRIKVKELTVSFHCPDHQLRMTMFSVRTLGL